ncbi:MAG: GtrA family protein [bacterium]|nr:GtrA family protein [bacterium]
MFKNYRQFWFNISDKVRFLLVGIFNSGVSYLIYAGLLYFILGESNYQIALVLAWIISSVISFTTHRTLVFPVEGNILKQYIKCCTTWVFSYILNAFLLWSFVDKLQINAYIAQIIATAVCAVFNYIMFKLFAFKKNNAVK